MTCDAYYDNHESPPPGSVRDRCAVPEIEGSTSKAVALLGASTTLFGLINLFVTTWTIKKIGLKGALLNQVFWAVIRLAVQNVGVMMGGKLGIIIVQSSQIITIIGGPNGYVLALNSFIAEVTEHDQRTTALGRLQGAQFFGISLGYLLGGELSERFGILAPFRVTLGLFMLSFIYSLVFLPSIALAQASEPGAKTQGIRRFFGPLKIFATRKWVLSNGRMRNEYGPVLLAAGVFLGILATGIIPVILQLYSQSAFGFGTRQNGALISLNSLLRGLFLTFMFPRIIAYGRKKATKSQAERKIASISTVQEEESVIPTHANEIDIADVMDNEQEPREPVKPQSALETFDFDLIYARNSLLLDGIFTGAATFIQEGWQIYLVAIALPFASGTGAASKGVILQMTSADERTDALSAITLVENVARLLTSKFRHVHVPALAIVRLISTSTASIFGLVFAALANIEKTYLVFAINAVSRSCEFRPTFLLTSAEAVALLGFFVLLFAHFPPKDSYRLEETDEE